MPRLPFAFRLLITLFVAWIALSAFARQKSTAHDPEPKVAAQHSDTQATPLYVPPGPLLPQVFAGWQLTGIPMQSASPQAADSANASALQEYGFARYETANYARGSDTLAVKAMQFEDATGSFGAFTLYRQPNMASEQIGQGAAFDGVRVIFWTGTVLVDATFHRITATSAAELRDLSTLLPKPSGNQGTLPTLPDYLPADHLQAMTVRYAIGPVAYQAGGGVLPTSVVDFGLSAEAITSQYDSLNGPGTLTIVNYPTPQIAIDRQHAMQALFTARGKTNGPKSNDWTSALANSNPAALQIRRSGPLVAVTSGSFSAGAAQEVLQRVHYEATLTVGGGKYVPDTTKLAQIILGVAYLVGIFALIAIVAAVSLGGGRVFLRRMRGKAGRSEDGSAEFIRLNLKD